MQGNYDRVAGFYDRLSRLVFADRIRQAQLFLLQAIPPGAHILVVGGGTGWILEEMARLHKSSLKITYIELSAQMMVRSKSRNAGGHQVIFRQEAIQEASLEAHYDVILTPFFFDNFKEQTLQHIFGKLDAHLKKGGYWLYADFELSRRSIGQRMLLRVMYLFFRLLCNIEASRLPDANALFCQYGYKATRRKSFFNGFIAAVVYRK